MVCKYCIESKFAEIKRRALAYQNNVYASSMDYGMSYSSHAELSEFIKNQSGPLKENFIDHACYIVNTECSKCKEEHCNHQYIQMIKDGKAVFACSKCFKDYDKKIKVK